MENEEMKKIGEIVNYYASPSYDGTEVEDDKNWTTDDLVSLSNAIDFELHRRQEILERDKYVVPSIPKLVFVPWTSRQCH